MKNNTVVAMLFVIGFSVIYGSCGTVFPIKGNGNLATLERSFSSFEKIQIDGSATVRFYASQEYRAVVTVDSNLVDYAEIVTDGSTLKIGTKDFGNALYTNYTVDVYSPFITSVSVSGSGRFDGGDDINTSTFAASVSGSSARFEAIVKCETFSVVSRSGKMTVTGNANNADIKVSGSGSTFSGGGFAINSANVNINGSGKATVNVSINLNANISGSGSTLNYYGDPTNKNINTSGGGKANGI